VAYKHVTHLQGRHMLRFHELPYVWHGCENAEHIIRLSSENDMAQNCTIPSDLPQERVQPCADGDNAAKM
jgi:hypothetical protein